MVIQRRLCAGRGPTGEPCQSPPLRDGQYCFMHSPEHAQEAQEARKLSHIRHKREATLSGAYDLDSVNSMEGLRRIVEIIIMDTLTMDNTISRNRALAYYIMVALKIKEVGDHETRIASLEQAVHGKHVERQIPMFDIENRLLDSGDKEKQNDNGKAS
jgi:hypothetical protein